MTEQTWTIQDAGYAELHCRDTGHQWDTNHKLGKRAPSFGTRRSLQCGSCISWRHEVVNSAGIIDVTTREYELTEEYEFACQFDRIECRAELMRRDRVQVREVAAGRVAMISPRPPARLQRGRTAARV